MRLINQIVIHCSASPNGVYVSPSQIDAWHAARGFHRDPAAVARFNRTLPHIGYHWIVAASGIQFAGRATEEIGAHAYGHNPHSVGICMIGTDRFFLRQFDTLATLICDLAYHLQTDRLLTADRCGYPLAPALAIAQLAKMGISIVGHRDLSPDVNGDGIIEKNEWLKTCPGFDVASWLATEMMPSGEELLDVDPAILNPFPLVRVAEALA